MLDSLDEEAEEDDEPAVRLKSAGEESDNEKEEKEGADDWEDDGVPEVNEAAALAARGRPVD